MKDLKEITDRMLLIFERSGAPDAIDYIDLELEHLASEPVFSESVGLPDIDSELRQAAEDKRLMMRFALQSLRRRLVEPTSTAGDTAVTDTPDRGQAYRQLIEESTDSQSIRAVLEHFIEKRWLSITDDGKLDFRTPKKVTTGALLRIVAEDFRGMTAFCDAHVLWRGSKPAPGKTVYNFLTDGVTPGHITTLRSDLRK